MLSCLYTLVWEDNMPFCKTSSINDIFIKKHSKRKRISSYDRTGGNDDRYHIKPNEKMVIADILECGLINHIWMTLMVDNEKQDPFLLRKVVLRCYWDDEQNPSVLTPVGDFFGMGHARSENFVSVPLQMSPQDGKALNSWWPMPFSKRAIVEIENNCEIDLIIYFYIDYETMDKLPEGSLRFHAKWHRECPTKGKDINEFKNHHEWVSSGENKTGKNNYLVLEAKGEGHYCGANLNIHNTNKSEMWDWPGEGDDMIFIDGEDFPSIHGTGTEDYINTAWAPKVEYHAPYHGVILPGDDNWKGMITYYRYHILDPITFQKEIKVTIEHGHNNHRSDDWSSTAYWYQNEPHQKFEEILYVNERLPLKK